MSTFGDIVYSLGGIPTLPHIDTALPVGNVFFVDSGHANASDTSGWGKNLTQPFATIDFAVGECTASNGDLIIVAPGHTESIDAAGALTLDTIGITILFLGSGSLRATLGLDATAGTILVTAANVTLIGPRFLTGIDAVVSALVVQAADFKLLGAEFYDAAGKAATIQVLTTNAAARMQIKGYKYFPSTTGTQKTDGIKIVGALDRIVLEDIDIVGDFSGGYPVNMTNAACTNVKLNNLDLNSLNAAPVAALGLHANTTGFAEDVRLRVASGTTYVSNNAKLQWGTDCVGYNSDGSGGSALGTATDITAKVDSVGAQASTVNSLTGSVGVQASTVQSKTDSIGVQTSTVNSIVASVAGVQSIIDSRIISVGTGNAALSAPQSTLTSKVDSVGIQASTTTSLGQSVGIQASTINSKADSIGINLSTVRSVTAANAASVASVGAQASTINSVVGANAASITSVGTNLSTVKSTVLANAASVGSVGTQVSTVNSVVGANAASIGSVGTQVSTVQSKVDSVGTGTSTVISRTDSISTWASTLQSAVQSTLTSIALIISTINSKT